MKRSDIVLDYFCDINDNATFYTIYVEQVVGNIGYIDTYLNMNNIGEIFTSYNYRDDYIESIKIRDVIRIQNIKHILVI